MVDTKRDNGKIFGGKITRFYTIYTVGFIGPTKPADKSYRINLP